MTTTYVRPATEAEVESYKAVEAIVQTMDRDTFESFVDTIADYVFYFSEDRKERSRVYGRVYRMAKKLGVTVGMLYDWYTMD